MGVAFVRFSWPHHGDFVCISHPKVGHFPHPENNMSNAHQTPSCVCVCVWGGGGGLEVMSRLGIDRAINKEKGGGSGKVGDFQVCFWFIS